MRTKTTGYFLFPRFLWTWPEFQKPYSAQLAWLYMNSEAEFRPGPLYGCVVASLNTLKEEWGWESRDKVKSLLDKWKRHGLIERIPMPIGVFHRNKTFKPIKLVHYERQQGGHLLKKLSYKDYLQTPEWKAIREKALKAWNYQCALCCSSDSLHVHHRNYNHVRHEKLKDLIVLCDKCHAKFHDKLK